MCMKLWWSDIDGGNPQYLEGTLFQGLFVHPMRRVDGALPPEKLKASLLSKIRDYSIYILVPTRICGTRGGVVVEVLRYKPEGRGFDSRWCQWNFSLT
jgi:hypothetical protein